MYEDLVIACVPAYGIIAGRKITFAMSTTVAQEIGEGRTNGESKSRLSR
jgi:hypothetical protein